MEKLSFTLTKDDIKDYVKYTYKLPRMRNFFKKQDVKVYLFACAVILVFDFLFSILPNLTSDINIFSFIPNYLEYVFWTIGPVFLFMLLFIVALYFISINDCFGLAAKTSFRTLENSSLDLNIELDEEGIKFYNEVKNSHLKWEGIVEVHNTGKSILIFLSNYQASVIPYRAFETPEKAEEFFNLIDSKVKAAKAKA